MPDPSEPARPAAGRWWRCVVLGPDGRATRFVVVESHAYPDDTRVELAEPMATTQIGDAAVCVAELDESGQVTTLRPSRRFAPKAPAAWFAEIRESTAQPPAVNLLAFTGAGQPVGALIGQADLPNVAVETSDQLGAIRWYPATGRVDQLYVQPQWRRRSVASALVWAAAGLGAARAWPRMWGDGQRTELGEQLRNASSWRRCCADLTHRAPPMTPGEA